MDDHVRNLSADFKIASGETAQPVLIPIDADLVAWFRGQGDIVREINDLCRFYMDTSIARELDFESMSEQAEPDQSAKPPLP
jgi:hypothetical protein